MQLREYIFLKSRFLDLENVLTKLFGLTGLAARDGHLL